MNYDDLELMRRRYLLMICFAMLGLAVISCQRMTFISEPPEYVKPLVLTLAPAEEVTLVNQQSVSKVSSCRQGDSITVFMPTTYAGSNITEATYCWRLKDANKTDLVKNDTTVIAPHKQPCPPKWTFKAPDVAGMYYVTFSAKYAYSASTEDGAIFGSYPAGSNYSDENNRAVWKSFNVY